MNEPIATKTNEPQDTTHYLINADDLSEKSHQKKTLSIFLRNDNTKMYLGGTTYQYSIWAVRTVNGIEIWHIPFDFSGRWVNAKKRSWN